MQLRDRSMPCTTWPSCSDLQSADCEMANAYPRFEPDAALVSHRWMHRRRHHEAHARLRPASRLQEASARGPLGRAGDPDAGFRRSLLLAGQHSDRRRRRAAAADLDARHSHQEPARRSALLADDRRAQGGRSARRRPRHADGNRGADRRSGCAPALSRAPAGGGDVRGLRRFRVLPDGAQRPRIWSPASAASSTSSRRTC